MVLWGQEWRSKRKIRRGWQLQSVSELCSCNCLNWVTPHLLPTPPPPPLPPPLICFHIVDNQDKQKVPRCSHRRCGDFYMSCVLLTFHLLLLTFFWLDFIKVVMSWSVIYKSVYINNYYEVYLKHTILHRLGSGKLMHKNYTKDNIAKGIESAKAFSLSTSKLQFLLKTLAS